jgi:hypothetical protein
LIHLLFGKLVTCPQLSPVSIAGCRFLLVVAADHRDIPCIGRSYSSNDGLLRCAFLLLTYLCFIKQCLVLSLISSDFQPLIDTLGRRGRCQGSSEPLDLHRNADICSISQEVLFIHGFQGWRPSVFSKFFLLQRTTKFIETEILPAHDVFCPSDVPASHRRSPLALNHDFLAHSCFPLLTHSCIMCVQYMESMNLHQKHVKDAMHDMIPADVILEGASVTKP